MKWAGGKTQLLGELEARTPSFEGTYLEPFVGGGALFFRLKAAQSRLSDLNAELIGCYTTIRDDVEALIEALADHRYEKEHYYQVRAQQPDRLDVAGRAARMIFLNRTGFNGLYRVNRKGEFNVPFGRYSHPTICDEENLRACSAALKNTVLQVADFEGVLAKATPRDFVYLDPPYAPISRTARFTSYVAGGFGWDAQERLADAVLDLQERGVPFLLSNSDSPAIRDLYAPLVSAGSRIDIVRASRSVNSKANRRGKVNEVLVSST